jgi:hypothetical protein
VAGIVGHILQEERQKAAAAATRAEEDRLLAQDNGPFAQRVKQQRQAEQLEQTYGWGEFDSLAQERVDALPESMREKISGKFYPGTPGAARKAFLSELIDLEREAATETNLKPTLEKAVKEAFEAGEKATLAKIAGGERSPSLGRGEAQAPTLDQAEFNAHRKDPDWRRGNKDRIADAVKAGRITH